MTRWNSIREGSLLVFANVRVAEPGRAQTYNGLVLEKLRKDDTASTSYRRLVYGEGAFLDLDEARPDLRRAADTFHSNLQMVFSTALFRSTGRRNTIHIVRRRVTFHPPTSTRDSALGEGLSIQRSLEALGGPRSRQALCETSRFPVPVIGR